MDDFTFDYGVIEYKHRFSINRSLDDYQVFRLDKVVTVTFCQSFSTESHDTFFYCLSILYRDESNTIQCLNLNLSDWTLKVIHLGDMKVSI